MLDWLKTKLGAIGAGAVIATSASGAVFPDTLSNLAANSKRISIMQVAAQPGVGTNAVAAGANQPITPPTIQSALHLTPEENIALLKANEEYLACAGREFHKELGIRAKENSPFHASQTKEALNAAVLLKADRNGNPQMFSRFFSTAAMKHVDPALYTAETDISSSSSARSYIRMNNSQLTSQNAQPFPAAQRDIETMLGAMYAGFKPSHFSPESTATYEKLGARILRHDSLADMNQQSMGELMDGYRSLFPEHSINNSDNVSGPQESTSPTMDVQ